MKSQRSRLYELAYIDFPTVPRPLTHTALTKLNARDMKFRINHLIFAGFLVGLFSSCAQDHNSTLYRSTGLFDALLSASGSQKDAVPVEFQSSSTYPKAHIIAARAVFASPGIQVYGYVRNSFGVSGSRGHVDIILRLENGQLVSAVPVDYFPRPIPPILRGSGGRSRFSAHFAEVPNGLASVIVRYHGGEKSNCPSAKLEGLKMPEEISITLSSAA